MPPFNKGTKHTILQLKICHFSPKNKLLKGAKIALEKRIKNLNEN